MSSPWSRCALCPRLCHSACPVALGSGREAAVPAVLASALLLAERGELGEDVARAAMTLCTDCGACQEHCHLDVPLPTYLREARARALPAPTVEPLRPLVGAGRVIAVESDGREWARPWRVSWASPWSRGARATSSAWRPSNTRARARGQPGCATSSAIGRWSSSRGASRRCWRPRASRSPGSATGFRSCRAVRGPAVSTGSGRSRAAVGRVRFLRTTRRTRGGSVLSGWIARTSGPWAMRAAGTTCDPAGAR
ncbi:MAG: 4Fe-4S dicluster domain-containing protein [Myxococcales bacterium]|nr:4Fe-4S dicluster domain-containing protein [Myxococcales bacterium]